jgi:hypothetical protein
MFTETVSPEFAAQLESCELNAWVDMYGAAPTDFARQFQLEMIRVQNIVLTRCKTIPFIHFNCIKNLGMAEPATEALVDEIVAIYREAGMRNFTFYHIPQWRGGWDRIYRNNDGLDRPEVEPNEDFKVEKVTRASGPEWATYIDSIYGLPTTPWLLALVNRPGWHHYVLRKRTEIVAVPANLPGNRQGWDWLGCTILCRRYRSTHSPNEHTCLS